MSDEPRAEPSESPDPAFRLPRPAWHYAFPGLLGLALFAIAATAEYRLLQPKSSADKNLSGVERLLNDHQRWPDAVLFGVILVLAPTIPLRYALTSPLVIRRHGIEIPRRRSSYLDPGFFFWVARWLFETLGWFGRLGRWDLNLTPWEQVGPCHWGRYNRATLTIPGPDGLVFIPIPERHRAEVEAAFRRSGRWQD